MAQVTLNAADRFPAGTIVSAYPASNWLQAQLPPSGAPQGAATASGTVGSNGQVTITGLAADTRYFAHASVGGEDRYVRFRTSVVSDPYTQTYATSSRTHAAPVATAPAATAATSTTPFGYSTAAQADAVRAGVADLITDVANVKQVLNAVIDDLQARGLLG